MPYMYIWQYNSWCILLTISEQCRNSHSLNLLVGDLGLGLPELDGDSVQSGASLPELDGDSVVRTQLSSTWRWHSRIMTQLAGTWGWPSPVKTQLAGTWLSTVKTQLPWIPQHYLRIFNLTSHKTSPTQDFLNKFH